MPKIDRPFVPQQPGAGTDNYIDGGPTRAGLEEVRGKVNAAPVTWATVAEAEAASYTPPESVVVTETGRAYTYSANSGATRDGIRVLTPAGGGRLLMTVPAMTDAEAVAATRASSPTQSGLMSAAQVMQLSAYISATANPTANHDGVDTASVGRPFHVGQTWFNEDPEILWQCVGNSAGAAKWIIVNPCLHVQERFAKNTFFDYWRIYWYDIGHLSRDTTNGGLLYNFDGLAYAGADGVGSVAEGIADQAVAVSVTLDQADINIKLFCQEAYVLELISGSTACTLYKNGGSVQIATATMGAALSTGTHEIMLVRRGSKLIGYLNGINIISVTDSTYQGGDSRFEINNTADGIFSGKINSYKLFQYQN